MICARRALITIVAMALSSPRTERAILTEEIPLKTAREELMSEAARTETGSTRLSAELIGLLAAAPAVVAAKLLIIVPALAARTKRTSGTLTNSIFIDLTRRLKPFINTPTDVLML